MSRKANSPSSLPLAIYEGPLDLLWDEVRRQNVAVEQIAMAPLAARFLEYVRSAGDQALGIDWLETAATLIYWKSRALIARPSDPACDPVRDELVERLLAYRRDAAEELDRRRTEEGARWSRPTGPKPEEETEAETRTVWDMIQQARELAAWVARHRIESQSLRQELGILPDAVTVSQMIGEALAGLKQRGALELGRWMDEQSTTGHRACLFLAVLDLAGRQEVEVLQNEAFGPIVVALKRDRDNALSRREEA